MNADEQQRLEMLVEQAVDAADRCLQERLDQVSAEYPADGSRQSLSSRSTINAAIRIMGEIAQEQMQSLLAGVGAVSRSPEGYDLAVKAMVAILDNFGQQLPKVIGLATAGRQGGSTSSAALGLYRDMRRSVEAALIIARQGFLSAEGQTPDVAPIKSATVPQNKGGKPLAEHWDALWSAIAVQLYTGDLKPKSQKEIKDAMFEWFNANSIEIGDTAVTQRARQLWQAMETDRLAHLSAP